MAGGLSMKENIKGGLLLSPETILAFRRIRGAERMKLLDCILDYHENGVVPDNSIDQIVLLSFNLFRMAYDKDQSRYKDKCERNRENQRKRWERVRAEEDDQNNTTEYDGIRPNTMVTNNNNNNNSNNNLSYTERERGVASLPHSPKNERYIAFVKFLGERCPHLSNMERPTEEQFVKLLEKVNGNATKLSELLLNMENDRNTPKKRRSIYRTALNWLNMEQKGL